MSSAFIGALRGLGLVVLLTVLAWLANQTNLSGLVNPTVGSLIAIIALTLEHAFSPPGTVFAGTVKLR
jgi:hypothetical protein